MHINELKNVTIADIVKDYVDNSENDEGISGFGGNLNIRPKYQRNYVYNSEQRAAVIRTLAKGFPLGIMYWVKNNDGKYEILDGQQRTISICQYVAEGMRRNGRDFSVSGLFGHADPLRWSGLTPTEQEKLLGRKLIVYECVDADDERLEWFETINIAGEKLSSQEIRNAHYPSAWLTDARRYFSRSHNNAAKKYADYYVKADWNRQGGLEKVIKWFINNMNDVTAIKDFMSKKKRESDIDGVVEATELWEYYQKVIDWAKTLFPVKREKIGEVEWGILYNKYHENTYDTAALEHEVARLYADNDVTAKEGIYEYIFDHSESHLHIRQFPSEIKAHIYELQEQKCKDCGQHFPLSDLQAHHNIRWIDGGHTTVENCVLLCRNCHGARHRAE